MFLIMGDRNDVHGPREVAGDARELLPNSFDLNVHTKLIVLRPRWVMSTAFRMSRRDERDTIPRGHGARPISPIPPYLS